MATLTAHQQLAAVVANTYPYDVWHDRYQEYYQTGLRRYLQLRGSDLRVSHHAIFPTFPKRLRLMRDASSLRRLIKRGAVPLGQALNWGARHTGAQHTPNASLVGEYSFWLNAACRRKVCIDGHDSGTINSPRGIEGVEHCMRLLEAVSKVRAKKFLLAELLIGDTTAQARRLRMSGIPTTTRYFDHWMHPLQIGRQLYDHVQETMRTLAKPMASGRASTPKHVALS